MNKVFTIAILLFLIGCNNAENSCNTVLNGAKKGAVFTDIMETKFINNKYKQYFDYSPKCDTTPITNNIIIPQYFESFKFLSSKDLGTEVIHKSMNIDKLKNLGIKDFDDFKEHLMQKENAQLKDGNIFYTEGEAKIKQMTYELKSDSKRYILKIICLNKGEGWKIFNAFYLPISMK